MYISFAWLVVLVYVWVSTSKSLKAANQRADNAEKQVRDLEATIREAAEREDRANRRYEQACEHLKTEVTWEKVAHQGLKAFPDARMALRRKVDELQASGEWLELRDQVQVDDFGNVVTPRGWMA